MYSARNETIATKASFKDRWKRGLRCVIPAEAVFEERYDEDLTHERWRIENEDGSPMGIAGIYSQWVEGGVEKFSYSMITVNCDGHPFYRQFHEPGHEKRMPVFLAPEEYDEWMSCPLAEAPRFFRMWMGALKGVPAARPKITSTKKQKGEGDKPNTAKPQHRPPPKPPEQFGLF